MNYGFGIMEELVMIEQRKRKVSKHGVVTTLGFPEGQMVTVARVDERTEIISLESPERVAEMVALLTMPHTGRHNALTERLRGQSTAPTTLPRTHQGVESDIPLTEADADKFSSPRRARRSF